MSNANENVFDESETDKESIEKILNFTKDKIATDILVSIEIDIKKVARKSSLLIWFQTKNLLRRKKSLEEFSSDEFFDEIFKELEILFNTES